jgi:excisionase family DNA binding protein
MSPKTEKLLYSRAEAAQMLGVCSVTLWKLIQRGELTPKYVGDRPMFSRAELERFAGVSA